MEKHANIPQLDGFRGFACLLVLAVHIWRYPSGHDGLNRLVGGGWIGVDLFFVLSGFLITRILLAAKGNPKYYRDFYTKRTLRIFPLYFAVLFFVFGVLPHVSHTPELAQAEHQQLWYWLYLSNFVIALSGWPLAVLQGTWSLAVEEQFYLLWPTIVRCFSAQGLRSACIAVLVISPILRGLALPHLSWTWCYVATPFRADALAWGALIALGGLDQIFERWAWPVLASGVALLAIALPTGYFAHDLLWVTSIGYTLTGATAAAGLWLTIRAPGSLFGSRPMRAIGRVSYGLYLLHPICEIFVSKLFNPAGLMGSCVFLAVTGLVAFAAASLSFRYFEAPFLRFKDRLTTGRLSYAAPGATAQ